MVSFVAEALLGMIVLVTTVWGAIQCFSCIEILHTAKHQEYELRVVGALQTTERNLAEASRLLTLKEPEAQREIDQISYALRQRIEEWALQTDAKAAESCGDWLELRVCVALHEEQEERREMPNWRFVWRVP